MVARHRQQGLKMAKKSIEIKNYSRLLSFAAKYKGRLLAGILAGILSAGSFFGLLSFMPDAFDAFRVSEKPEAAEELFADMEPPGDVSGSQDASVPNPDNLPGWFRQAEDLATKFGIPLRAEDDTITWQALVLGLLALPLIAFCRIITSFMNRYFMRWVGSAVVKDIRNELFASLQKQSLRYYGNSDIGQLISSTVNDTASVEHVISSTVAEAAKAPFEIVAAAAFAVIFAVNNGLGRFILTGGLLLPLCLVPVVLLGTRVKRWTRKSLERISLLVSRMHENFTGIRVVKAFNTEKEEEERFLALNGDYFKAVVKSLKAELLMSPLMEMVTTVLATGFIIACFIFRIKLSEIIIIGVAVFAAYRPLKQVAQINAWLQRGSAALDRIFAILDTDTSLPESPDPVSKRSFDDKISFENVSFAFSKDGPVVVENATFDLKRGNLLALVGETGSGKSTYANLLARFYDPTRGRIAIDGIDLRDVATSDLRRLVGVVTQDTILFNDTIANNIAYGTPGATKEAIEAAAKMANAHDFIVSHPEGYGRMCGEKGFLLSGGEKQRIALARAILKNPPILILDEATSALDTVTEKLVQDAISKVMENRTTLAIAHRLSTVRNADMILVIDKGRISECGTHDSLYEKNGKYRRLCDMQLNG